jgi:hypothetical protein
VDNIVWVATERDVSQVVKILDKCGANIIELARRFGLQFDHTKTLSAIFMFRRDHTIHLQPKLSVMIGVIHRVMQLSMQTICCLSV